MKFIDSHTGGEPTRVIIEGGPDLGDGDLHERLDYLRSMNHEGGMPSWVLYFGNLMTKHVMPG